MWNDIWNTETFHKIVSNIIVIYTVLISNKINVRENRRGNLEWTYKSRRQQWTKYIERRQNKIKNNTES